MDEEMPEETQEIPAVAPEVSPEQAAADEAAKAASQASLQAEIASLQVQIAQLEAFKVQAEAQLAQRSDAVEATARADAAEAQIAQFARLCLETDARKVLGPDARFDGQDDAAVMSAAVAKVFVGLSPSATELPGAFKAAVVSSQRQDTRHASVLGALNSPVTPEETPREKMLRERAQRAGV